ncbi:hypothetical protein [Mycobacterium sp. OAE908]|uniref:hypothetical protein n=1 Tax=Mycobacterium sp. OAE908 TaxID=2817899 RepID=UPI001AE696F2
MTQTKIERLHIVEGSPWKDAVIALLDSRSPYRPWRHGFGAQVGDAVAIVLDTDPASILTTLGRVGIDGRMDRAVVEWSDHAPTLVDLTTLTAVMDFSHDQDPRDVWQLHGDAAVQMELALDECRYRGDPSMRYGHSTVAAARILLHSQGTCTGCDDPIDMTGEDARDVVHIRTVDAPRREGPEVLIQAANGRASYIDGPYSPKSWLLPTLPADWPGVLCERCVVRMQNDGHNGLLDFRFSQHPRCPRCGAQRTQRGLFGEPSTQYLPPWRNIRGCCVNPEPWTCAACAYQW